MKRTLSILMTLLLLWSLVLPAAAAETAATLRLEKTEGTVKVSNASGKSVTVTKGMRLYSGYTIATEKDSYAYVSLDSTKAVKLDASSKAEVQKSGKKLELTLISGKLFFNVTAPVEKDESVNIRTSTMVTGVRGTSGWVEVVDRFTSRVHLLEGTLTVTSAEPATGQMRQVVITGGQTATATLKGTSQPGSQMTLTVTAVKEEKVPGFVAVEVANDPVLQEKISTMSPLSVPKIIGDAEERLKAEQESADLAQEAIDEQLEKISADQVEQVFESQPEPEDDDFPVYVTLDLNNPTAAELTAALARTDVTRVNLTDAGGAGSNLDTASYTVRSGQTLDIQSGMFTVGSGNDLNVEGILTNGGTITIQSNNSVHVKNGGSLTNNGIIKVGDEKNAGKLEIQLGGTLENKNAIIINSTPVVNEISKLENSGTFKNSGSFGTQDNSNVISAGLFTNSNSYTENRDGLYAMAKSTDGAVSYLGPAGDMSGWYDNTTVTLMGGESGTLQGGSFNASNVTLNLNGKQVELEETLAVGSGVLTIEDNSTGRLGIKSGTAIQVSGGTLNMTGGTVTSSTGTAIRADSGSVTVSGGAIEGYTYGIYIELATVKIEGGTVTLTAKPGDDALDAYAVSGPFAFSGGTLLTNIEESFYTLEPTTPEGSELYCPPDNGNGYFQLTLVRGD